MSNWIDEILNNYKDDTFDAKKYIEESKKQAMPKVKEFVKAFKSTGFDRSCAEYILNMLWILSGDAWFQCVKEVLDEEYH